MLSTPLFLNCNPRPVPLVDGIEGQGHLAGLPRHRKGDAQHFHQGYLPAGAPGGHFEQGFRLLGAIHQQELDAFGGDAFSGGEPYSGKIPDQQRPFPNHFLICLSRTEKCQMSV